VVFLWIRPGQVPEEPQPEGLDPFRDWQAACILWQIWNVTPL